MINDTGNMNHSDDQHSATIATITSLEKEWMAAWARKDVPACDIILSEDFMLSSATGAIMNKKEWMENVIGPFTAEEFIWEWIKVRIYGDTAVVNATIRQKASIHDIDWSGYFNLTDVWIHADGRWKVVSRQGNGPFQELPDPGVFEYIER